MKAPVTIETIRALHDEALEVYGGIAGDREDPEACIGSAMNQCLYQFEPASEGGVATIPFAVALFFCLARRHKFSDGNKRTAWMSMMYVLACEHWTIDAGDGEVEEFVNAVASNHYDLDECIVWVAERLESVALG